MKAIVKQTKEINIKPNGRIWKNIDAIRKTIEEITMIDKNALLLFNISFAKKKFWMPKVESKKPIIMLNRDEI